MVLDWLALNLFSFPFLWTSALFIRLQKICPQRAHAKWALWKAIYCSTQCMRILCQPLLLEGRFRSIFNESRPAIIVDRWSGSMHGNEFVHPSFTKSRVTSSERLTSLSLERVRSLLENLTKPYTHPEKDIGEYHMIRYLFLLHKTSGSSIVNRENSWSINAHSLKSVQLWYITFLDTGD